MAEIQTGGTLETPADAGKGGAGVVQRWLLELELADKEEEDWRIAARETVERYRDESKAKRNVRKGASRFNILWANVEVMRPSLYSATPRPDVRRRYRDPDPTSKVVADVMERACKYAIDAYDFDQVMNLAVLDYLLPGRSVTRVRYVPTNDDAGEVAWEKACSEHVPWARFRRGPASCWDDVPWIAFEHLMTREELDESFPGKKIELDVELKGEKDRTEQHDLFKRGRVWEIWHKEKRELIWIAPSNTDGPVKVESDPLGLRNFYPVPRPLYALETSDSLVPVEEYRLYKDQADELDEVTHRIRRLVSALKVKGIYDSVMPEVGKLLEGGDNEMIPSEGAQNILAQTQTLDRHIWMMPINVIAQVLTGLYQQRDQIKQTIYEITGLSDILRGSTDAQETLGAQQLKAQTGSLRLQRRQREVQRYARDLIEMQAEIMVEHFAPQTLSIMTGVQVDPQALELLKNGGMRDYRIDVETDSTIAPNAQAEQEEVTRLIQGIGGYFEAVGPAVQTGALSMQAAKAILTAAVRRFRFGREVEQHLEDEEAQQQPQGPSEEQMEQIQQQAMEQAQQAVEQERMAVQAEAQKVQAERASIGGMVDQAKSQDDLRKQTLQLQERDALLKVERAAMDLEKKQIELGALEQRVTDMANKADDAQSGMQRVEEMEAEMEELAKALAQLAQVLAQGMEQNQQSTQQLLMAMSAPREIERDANGRVTGARVRLDS